MKRANRIREVFHTITVAFAIILFWRGVWGLMDIYLFPENYLLSSIASILIGIIILYSTKKLTEHLL